MEQLRVEIHEAFQRYQRDNGTKCHEGLGRYVETLVVCLFNYTVKHDYAKRARELSARLDELTFDDILERASAQDVDAILHLSLRYLGGFGIRESYQSTEGALWVVDSLIDPACDLDCYAGDIASRAAIAQGHSIAAHAYHKKALAPAEELIALTEDEHTFARPTAVRMGIGLPPCTYFLLAVHHANESVRRGLVSFAVLAVGSKIRQMGESLGVDVERAAREGKRYRPLWQVVSQYYEEIFKRHCKTEGDQNVPVCSADGCQVRGGKSQVLRACGGRCSANFKPSYCSRECQRKDWARHKAICKPYADKTIPAMSAADKVKVKELFELGELEDTDDTTSGSETEDESALESDEEDEGDEDEDEDEESGDESDEEEDSEEYDEEDSEEYEEEDSEDYEEDSEDDEELRVAEERRAEEERRAAEARRAAKKQRKAAKRAVQAKERAEARERLAAQKAQEAKERAEERKRRAVHKAMTAKRRIEAKRAAAMARREAMERRLKGVEAHAGEGEKESHAFKDSVSQEKSTVSGTPRCDDVVPNGNKSEHTQVPTNGSQRNDSRVDGGARNEIVANHEEFRNNVMSGCIQDGQELTKPTSGESAVEDDDSDTESILTVSLADDTDLYELTRWASMPDHILVPRRLERRHSNPF